MTGSNDFSPELTSLICPNKTAEKNKEEKQKKLKQEDFKLFFVTIDTFLKEKRALPSVNFSTIVTYDFGEPNTIVYAFRDRIQLNRKRYSRFIKTHQGS